MKFLVILFYHCFAYGNLGHYPLYELEMKKPSQSYNSKWGVYKKSELGIFWKQHDKNIIWTTPIIDVLPIFIDRFPRPKSSECTKIDNFCSLPSKSDVEDLKNKKGPIDRNAPWFFTSEKRKDGSHLITDGTQYKWTTYEASIRCVCKGKLDSFKNIDFPKPMRKSLNRKLEFSIRAGHYEYVRKTLLLGANPNAHFSILDMGWRKWVARTHYDVREETVLLGNLEILKLMLNNGAKPHEKYLYGSDPVTITNKSPKPTTTMLYSSVRAGRDLFVKEILDRKKNSENLNYKVGYNKLTPLERAELNIWSLKNKKDQYDPIEFEKKLKSYTKIKDFLMQWQSEHLE